MKIRNATSGDIPALRSLWQEAFGDTDPFLDSFFSAAFAPERSRCVFVGDALAAALYWFDCTVGDAKIAYIYAVATAAAHRGQGLCRTLMDSTHAHLQTLGYAGAVLVPGEASLFEMYEKMGYQVCSHMGAFSCAAGAPLPLREVSADEYAILRRQLLSDGGVVQEKENLAFLQTFARFFAGEGFLLAADLSGEALSCIELLGNSRLAPEIVAALGKKQGSFRCPGNDRPFAMFLPLQDGAPVPTYFGLAFD